MALAQVPPDLRQSTEAAHAGEKVLHADPQPGQRPVDR
jgi:hypothetical protein